MKVVSEWRRGGREKGGENWPEQRENKTKNVLLLLLFSSFLSLSKQERQSTFGSEIEQCREMSFIRTSWKK